MPIFEPVFGAAWNNLPPVFKRHYEVEANSSNVTTVKGVMVIEMSWLMKLFSPIMRFFGLLIPFEGKFNTTVNFKADGRAFVFDRIVEIAPTKIFNFKSKMMRVRDNIMLEKMALGLRWKAAYSYKNGHVTIAHLGYQFYGLPLPLEWIFGRGDAYEEVIDETHFKMKMTITHPIFKLVYAYSGEFEMV